MNEGWTMSELPHAAGLPDEASRQRPPGKDESSLPGSGPPADQGGLFDQDTAREVEAALGAMSVEDLAQLTGEVPAHGRGEEPGGTKRIGRIVGIYGDDVFIDLGGKSQGVVPRPQFGKEEVVQVGREVEVVIERFDADSGLLIASRDGAIREARWESMEIGAFLEGRITGMNKGGLEVNLNGIRGFMPASQVDIAHVKDISVFIGQKVRCEIFELNRREGNVLVSRRKYLEKEQRKQKEEALANLAEGQILKGVVGNLTEFGAFVDLGGVDGLIHISDLSYGQVGQASDVVQAGQTVEVKVLKVNRERERVALGLKQVKPDPWAAAAEKYPLNTNVTVRVLRLEKFGAFVELEEGVEGLIPLSEMSWSRVGKVSKILQVGQMVEAVVIRLEPERRRIALSIRQVEPDPWEGVTERFPKNLVTTGTVTKCLDFGAFVQLAPGVEGLAHISELAERRVNKCEEVVRPHQEIQVRVLSVDADQRRIALSLKAAEAPPADKPAAPKPQPAQPKKKKRKKPLRGGLTSHFEWQGQPLEL